jgi:hypothetical protein
MNPWPDGWIDGLTRWESDCPLFKEVVGRVGEWPLFGPWIAFKAADVLERVCGVKVLFPNDITMLYKEPRAALDILELPPEEANEKLLKHFAGLRAPPDRKRWCNIQEVETVLCKWKSSVNGHYFVGKDIHEIRKGLTGWGETAARLRRNLPPEVQKKGTLF